MKTAEAAQLIEAMADALAEDPHQFHFDVHVTSVGAMAIGGPGGPAMVGQSFGGGTGIYASAGSPTSIRIAQSEGEAAAAAEVKQAGRILHDLAAAVREKDQGKARSTLAKLQRLAVIPAVVAQVATIASTLAGVLS